MMLDRIKAKRDAVNEEIALHEAVINNLIDRREVYDEIIKEEEALVEAAPAEDVEYCDMISFGKDEVEE